VTFSEELETKLELVKQLVDSVNARFAKIHDSIKVDDASQKNIQRKDGYEKRS
jgi:hypothetical protein